MLLFVRRSLREKCLYSEFSGPYFPTFGMNTESYSVSFRIQSECGKMRTGKYPKTDTFHAVGSLWFWGYQDLFRQKIMYANLI